MECPKTSFRFYASSEDHRRRGWRGRTPVGLELTTGVFAEKNSRSSTDGPAAVLGIPCKPISQPTLRELRVFLCAAHNTMFYPAVSKPPYISTSRPNGFCRIYDRPFLQETAAPVPIPSHRFVVRTIYDNRFNDCPQYYSIYNLKK